MPIPISFVVNQSLTTVSIVADRGGVHQSAGDLVEVSKDVANALVRPGRALYVAKADDPDKGGHNTASKDMLKAAEQMAKAS